MVSILFYFFYLLLPHCISTRTATTVRYNSVLYDTSTLSKSRAQTCACNSHTAAAHTHIRNHECSYILNTSGLYSNNELFLSSLCFL